MMASMSENGLVLSGYQKKLKTMKKKFFVLYKETTNTAARLEYFDTEKKFTQRADPKRVIYLKSCFNINRRLDTKHKFVLVLATKDGGFGIVLNSESDLRKWLDSLLSIQRDNANGTDEVLSPYDYVWQVVVQKKGMAENVGITGSYHCCLTSKSLTFMCIGQEKFPNGDSRIVKVEVLLTTIRRCGHASPQSLFYMELGRQSVLGSGELWMETEDGPTAKNMHDMILNAMSATTESNMNLLNAYKGKPELTSEPMRKRSSSATEASKPINVSQKRQHSIEIKSSFSPQYNSYGRERCDSLPTRNRALSECSNQAYIALKHGHRCNTISGSRPYSTHKHYESPPINTPMKCSESEESSISIDEADDKGIYDAYRINSRSSKGVILEENIDDLTASDNSKFSRINENFENYISMTPMKSTYETINANHLNNCVGSNTLLNSAEEYFSINFPEHASEKLETEADVENHCERPSRAYSIGSKVEHMKMKRIVGNLNEVDNSSPRVRAYSVGSKSKIPRCEIQRGVLFSKVKKGHNHKGSNCNVTMDGQIGGDVTGMCTQREKKSTSAPMLTPRNYINTDRMSDLMEIDFSNVSTTSTSSQEQNFLNNFNALKINANPNTCSNGNIRQSDMLKEDESPIKNFINHTDNSDSGYLEMKPVGKVNPSSKQTNLEDQMEKLRSQNTRSLQAQLMQNDSTNDSRHCNIVTEKSSYPGSRAVQQPVLKYLGDKSEERTPETNASSSITNSIINTNVNNAEKQNSSNSKCEEPTKLDLSKTENSNLNTDLGVSNFATVERKLIHSVSNEDYSKQLNKSNEAADTKEVGYQILQIKSDSSLISKKKNQRPIYKPQAGVNTVEASKTSTNTKNNIESKVISEDLTTDNVLNKDENSTSSASSSAGLCGHELVYASLDLPQCSGQNTTKCLKKASCESPPVSVCFENISSYAKIDFDQSDSSSASSKVCNV